MLVIIQEHLNNLIMFTATLCYCPVQVMIFFILYLLCICYCLYCNYFGAFFVLHMQMSQRAVTFTLLNLSIINIYVCNQMLTIVLHLTSSYVLLYARMFLKINNVSLSYHLEPFLLFALSKIHYILIDRTLQYQHTVYKLY